MSNQDDLGVVILGAGRWGTHLIRNFLNQSSCRIVAIADPSTDRLHDISQRFDLGSTTTLTPDWKFALDLPTVDAAIVATPASTHTVLIQAALERGHHVLAEKPLALNPSEAIALCQLAQRQKRQLVVDHTYLFHPAIQAGRRWLNANSSSIPHYGYATRTHLGPIRHDVDALWDLVIHDIAILNYWLNDVPIQAQAYGQNWLHRSVPSVNSQSNRSDLVWVRLIYPNGFQAWIHLCWLNPDKQRRLCVVSDQSALVFDELQLESPLTLHRGCLNSTPEGFHPIYQEKTVIPVLPEEPLQRVCAHFLQCARHNHPSDISAGWVAVQLIQIIDALTQSLNQDGHLVQITPPIR
ncbi:MAG: Gfo/Idh/MocA family oxidoreductase [Elainellaceae cyanobacterium]